MSAEVNGKVIEDPFTTLPARERALVRGLGVTGISTLWRMDYTSLESVVIHMDKKPGWKAESALSDWAQAVFGLKGSRITYLLPPEPEAAEAGTA